MADNTVVNVPASSTSGDTIAADEIGGVKYQRVKISIGADGSASDCATGNPLPVSDASGSLTVDNAGTFAVQESGGALTSLQLLDDAVATDGSAATAKGFTVCGTDGTNAQTISTNATGHVNIADGGNTLTVDNGGTFAVQAAQSGTWTVQPGNTANTTAWLVTGTGGSFPVTDSSGSLTVDAPAGTPVNVQVGDGTRQATVRDTGASDSLNVSVVDASGNQITSFGVTQYAEDGASTGGESLALAGVVRRDTASSSSGTDGDYSTLNVDSTGRLWCNVSNTVTVTGTGGTFPITDSSGSITVDAPVATPVFVRLSDGSAAISTLPVSLASVPSHAVTNAGTFATQIDGSALTALQLIDDPVATAASAIPTKGFAVCGTDGTNARIVAVDTSGNLQVDVLTAPSTAVTNAGTFAVQVDSGAAVTSLQLIDDAVATTGASITSKGFAAVGTDGTNARILKTDTSGELQVDVLSMPTTTVTGTGGTFPVTDSGGSLTVDDGSSSLTVDNGGTFAVQVDGSALTSLQLIDDAIATDDAAFAPATGKVMMAGFEFDDSSPDSVNEGDAGAARMSANRNIYTTIRDAAGNERGVNVTAGNALTVDGSASTQPVSGNVGTLPLTSGGLSMSKTISAASVNATSVKASAGQLYAVHATNINASPRYLKFYNASSSPTVGTDTPVLTLIIPGSTAGGVLSETWPQGLAFSTGIAFGITTGIADNNSTAISASETAINVMYK